MDVHIAEVRSTVEASDSQALLSPEVLEQVVRHVMQRLTQQQGHRERVEAERRLQSGVSARDEG